ncbi:MAG: Na+/H+ antiporter subunit E [Desulfofustis sp.]|jgi:multicomponent Na+:H+ antiporter subunit E|nr:Na+/H+ antiporter subunit E [Desulfofustis sp.]
MFASLWYLLGRRLVGFSLLWWLLVGDSIDSWPAGMIIVPLAVLLSLALRPPVAWRISLPAALTFIPFFLQQSIRGGLDVAGRAFSTRLPLDPDLLEHPLHLPRGTARIFLLNTISLLPGTLSADLVDDRLVVHCLDTNGLTAGDLRRLEDRIAALFMLDLSGGAND